MKITILYDNRSSSPGVKEAWGFSCLIGKKVLFDTGGDPGILSNNAEILGQKLSGITDIVISHDHWDHTGGIEAALTDNDGANVHICPGFSAAFREKVRSLGGKIVEHKEFGDITEGVSVTGAISGIYKEKEIEEQAVVVRTDKGITLITGCAHPGIVKIAEKVKKNNASVRMNFVLGGFHLKNVSAEEIKRTAEQLRTLGFIAAGPCHCSGDEAPGIFKEVFTAGGSISVSAGKEFEV
ncbi:MAG: MBL fold metallo-hydrolase [Candidatus Omnitrophica bacterium]|nr:MBL fold metallo-hydrolase [Candidatus Omnitrophota bacterium]